MSQAPIRVAILCTGNICRSPMAEVVLAQVIDDDPSLKGRVCVSSAGVANWHVGSAMDPRARRALDRARLMRAGTLAAYADRAYLDSHDIVVVMTREHVDDVRGRLTNPETEVLQLRDALEPGLHLDVADPYYGDDSDFDECLALIRECCRQLTSEFRRRLGAGSREA